MRKYLNHQITKLNWKVRFKNKVWLGSFLSLIPFRSVMFPLLIAYLGIGVLIGAFGGVSAIRNYLKV